MCIGIPMQVIASGFGYARCQGLGMTREVETLLVGDQPVGIAKRLRIPVKLPKRDDAVDPRRHVVGYIGQHLVEHRQRAEGIACRKHRAAQPVTGIHIVGVECQRLFENRRGIAGLVIVQMAPGDLAQRQQAAGRNECAFCISSMKAVTSLPSG